MINASKRYYSIDRHVDVAIDITVLRAMMSVTNSSWVCRPIEQILQLVLQNGDDIGYRRRSEVTEEIHSCCSRKWRPLCVASRSCPTSTQTVFGRINRWAETTHSTMNTSSTAKVNTWLEIFTSTPTRTTGHWVDRGSRPTRASSKTNPHRIPGHSNYAVVSIEKQGKKHSNHPRNCALPHQ